MVLPKYENVPYIKLSEGVYFGVIDIVGSIMQNEDKIGNLEVDDWISYKEYIKRQFTIMAQS